MTWLTWVVLIIGAYLLGSIPSGYILVKLKHGIDIRRVGSGNVGTTNTMRAGGKWLGALTLVLDTAKSAVPTLIGMSIDTNLALVAGLAAFIGHLWPIWLGFNGGKGVATALGVALVWHPLIAAVCLLFWGVILLATGYVSLASCAAVLLVPILALINGDYWVGIVVFLVMAILTAIRHRSNFAKIKAGTEDRKFRNKQGSSTTNHR